jgi:hypothetical protein
MVHGACNGHDEDDVFFLIDTGKALLQHNLWRLRILDTENALLKHILRRVELPNLIWLHWKKCPHSSLPSWVLMRNLSILRVSESVLNTLCQKEGKKKREKRKVYQR